MGKSKMGFVGGFVTATVLCGAAAVYSAGEIYVPASGGNWIRDILKYNPDSSDQINVLADIAPGTAVQMLEVGTRLNALNGAAKKKNWNHAAYQLEELQAALEKLQITRPSRAAVIQTFLDTQVPPVAAAIAAEDKAAFRDALGTMAAACTQCHVDTNHAYLVVKVGKSASPIE